MKPSKKAIEAAFGNLCIYNVAVRQLEAAYEIDVAQLEKRIEELEKMIFELKFELNFWKVSFEERDILCSTLDKKLKTAERIAQRDQERR